MMGWQGMMRIVKVVAWDLGQWQLGPWVGSGWVTGHTEIG